MMTISGATEKLEWMKVWKSKKLSMNGRDVTVKTFKLSSFIIWWTVRYNLTVFLLSSKKKLIWQCQILYGNTREPVNLNDQNIWEVYTLFSLGPGICKYVYRLTHLKFQRWNIISKRYLRTVDSLFFSLFLVLRLHETLLRGLRKGTKTQ